MCWLLPYLVVFCEEVLLAAWVYKLRLTMRSSVVSIILFLKRHVSFLGIWASTLWWQRNVILHLLSCTRLVGFLSVCVCVLYSERQLQKKFPHIWWQRWDRYQASQNHRSHPFKRRRTRRRRVSQDIGRLQTIFVLNIFFEFYILLPSVCFTVLFSCAFSSVGVSCSFSVQWTTRGEHGWQGQKASSTVGRIGCR